jgi:S1-C subfamily serine protease
MARFLGAGQAATAGVVSASVGALAEGALKAMLVSKLQIATAVIIMAATTSVGVGGVIYQVEATERASGQSRPSRQVESPVMKDAAQPSEPSEKVKKRLSAIVCLKIEYPNASGQSSIIGVVMDRRGCILTACIPVEKAKKIRAVFRDGSVHDADSWITAPATGLAVVQLEKPLAQDQLVVKFAAPPSVSVGETVWIARMPGSGNRSNLVLDRSIVMRLDQRLRINPTLEKRVFKGIVHIDGGVDLGSPVLNREGELAGLCFLASEKGVGPATALSAERVEEAFNDLMKR